LTGVGGGSGAAQLFGVWAVSPNDVWAAGDLSRVYRRNSTGWSAVSVPSSALAGNFVSVLADGNGAEVLSEQGKVLRFDNMSTYLTTETLTLGSGVNVYQIGGSGNFEVVVGGVGPGGGGGGPSGPGVIYERTPVVGVWNFITNGATEIRAVWNMPGFGTAVLDSTGTVYLALAGTSTYTFVAQVPTVGITSAFWAEPDGTGSISFAVGGRDGKLYVRQNGTITGYGCVTGAMFQAAWGTSITDLWAVGNVGRIAYFDGTTLTEKTSPLPAQWRSISGTATNDIWVVGDLAIAHYSGP
jgi:hypothetical protein